MQAHSDNWDYAIRSGATRVSYVDLYYPASATLPSLANLPLESFDITVDRRSDIRRTGRMKIDSELLLNELKRAPGVSPLEPYGAEFRIRHGVIHNDGTEETMPMGIFHSESLAYTDPSGLMNFDLVDRSKVLKRKLYGFPRDASGQLCSAVIAHPINGLLPYAQLIIDTDVVDIRIPGGVIHKGDMLTIVQETAASMGAEMYFDAAGIARVRKVPVLDVTTFSGTADWEVDTGEEGVLARADIDISRKDTYNRVLVVGVNPSENVAAVYADVQDSDPRSPTYYYGPFGQSDKWIDDNKLSTIEMCIARAMAELANARGMQNSLKLKTLGNPALEEGDIIRVTFLDGSRQYHLVDSYTIDNAGQMNITTRTEITAS